MMEHKVFGIKENHEYIDRAGAYLIPIKDGSVGVVQTPKGYFLLGGGLDSNETDEVCIRRECLEEVGFSVVIEKMICSAETYCRTPSIGFFHPVQTYYIGNLDKQMSIPIEDDHRLVWMPFQEIKGKMYVEMQSWAIEQCWIAKGFENQL